MNLIFPSGPLPAPAQEIATRFCMESANSPDYEKIKGLEIFNSYDQLLIRRSVDERDRGKPNVPNCYEILSRTGQPLFKAVQILEHIPEDHQQQTSSSTPFKLSIFELRTGNEVLKITAKQGPESGVVSVRQNPLEYHGIGKIQRTRRGNHLKGPDYNVRGVTGKSALKINGGCCFMYKKACFDITTGDNSHAYGKIFKEVEDEERRYHKRGTMAVDDVVYRIRFPIDISMTSKALILSTTLILDYDYFHCGAKEAKSNFLLMSAALAFVSLLVVMVVIVLTVSITTKFSSLPRLNSTGNELDKQYEVIDTSVHQPLLVTNNSPPTRIK